jgi:hypothetical protein
MEWNWLRECVEAGTFVIKFKGFHLCIKAATSDDRVKLAGNWEQMFIPVNRNTLQFAGTALNKFKFLSPRLRPPLWICCLEATWSVHSWDWGEGVMLSSLLYSNCCSSYYLPYFLYLLVFTIILIGTGTLRRVTSQTQLFRERRDIEPRGSPFPSAA